MNPISYSFEAVSTDEFYDRVLDCAPNQIVPSGPGYENPEYQGCAFTGAEAGSVGSELLNPRPFRSLTDILLPSTWFEIP